MRRAEKKVQLLVLPPGVATVTLTNPHPGLFLFAQGLKPGLHVDTNGATQPSTPLTAPPTLQPFFNDLLDADSQSSLVSSLKVRPPA